VGPIDVLNHFVNFLLPALGLGVLATALAKLVFRRALRAARWACLALWVCAACVLVAVGGLLVFGRDGTLATLGAMVLAASVTLWWFSFGPGRR